MPHNMKSVMIFDPVDSDEQTETKYATWLRDNKSSIGDKAVPGKEETAAYLRKYEVGGVS